MDWKFQLVIQFDASTLEDYDDLVNLEGRVDKHLRKGAVVDGHDFGLGEFNIFVHTDSPKAIFAQVQRVLEHKRPRREYRAGYRKFSDDDYVSIWPTGSREFVVK